ncbi:YqhG family protein [Paenibacillus protaetiae]|uniref:YqhG family protein n=1 Tax=Paenibacillus protaetiae TaxID=2509456 RepID=UPI002677F8F6
MNEKQVHKFVQRYLDATGCQVLEKSPHHLVAKLSPQADRELTNRPYYWGFVDRTGAEPETMTFLFVTDKAKYDAVQEQQGQQKQAESGTADAAAESALSRSFGFLNPSALQHSRVPREDVYFGSRKLEQLFGAARSQGSYVYLFQEPDRRQQFPLQSTPYTAWLGVNIRVEFACDRKREEIHSFGVSLATGRLMERFHDRLLELKLTPACPPIFM